MKGVCQESISCTSICCTVTYTSPKNGTQPEKWLPNNGTSLRSRFVCTQCLTFGFQAAQVFTSGNHSIQVIHINGSSPILTPAKPLDSYDPPLPSHLLCDPPHPGCTSHHSPHEVLRLSSNAATQSHHINQTLLWNIRISGA